MNGTPGFFVRDTLGQTPGQQGVNWCTSPDIIFCGAQGASDPTVFTTTAGYATDYGSNIIAQHPPVGNFVYLRALSTGSPATGRAWFYWVENDLALWPANWNTTLVQVEGNQQNYQDIVATAANPICMPADPYIWSPEAPAANMHYCCISWIEYPPSTSPSNPVLQFPSLASWNDLANFVLTHPNMGWRNTNVVASGIGWSQTTNITGPTTAGQFWVGVQCTNMPMDGQLSYSIPGPTPDIPTINVGPIPISNPDMYSSVKIANWPGGAQSSITIQYFPGQTPAPGGSNIVATLMIPTTDLSEETRALARRVPDRLLTIRPDMVAPAHRPADLEGNIEVLVLGSQTNTFAGPQSRRRRGPRRTVRSGRRPAPARSSRK